MLKFMVARMKATGLYLANAGLAMTSGTLDFVDNGIRVYNSGTNTFTENVTGGTIRTAYDFRNYRTTWTPTGGTLELYGTTDATLYTIAGSNLFNLTIDKSAKASSTGEQGKDDNHRSKWSAEDIRTLKA